MDEDLKNSRRINAVFFDLGNTLVTGDEFLEEDALKLNQKLFKSIGYDFSIEELRMANKRATDYTQKKYRGNPKIHGRGVFLSAMCKFLHLNIDKELIERMDREFRKKYHASFKLVKHAKEILSYLKNNGFILVLISNGSTEGVNEIIDNVGLRPYFDLIIISEEIGKQKCTTVPIKVALERLGLRPEEVVMVGDRLDEDIIGAKRLGMVAIKHDYGKWKDVNYSGEDVKPDFVIRDLLELRKILETLENRKELNTS